MDAYLPRGPAVAAAVAAVLAGILLLGFTVIRIRSVRLARLAAWVLVVGGTAGVERLCFGEPAGFRMLALIGAVLFGMKAVVTVEAQADGVARLQAWQWFAFAGLWPGMRPALFARAGTPALAGAGTLLALGTRRFAVGAALTAAAWWVAHGETSWSSGWAVKVAATALLLPGLSLMLHFGVFNVLAGVWRLAGVDARPLFRAPLRARSLTEFWGRRWNLAFSEMTAVGVYRPLAGIVGKRGATVGAFLCSGLLHEVAISVPVRAGFGLPLLYFALHGLLVLAERGLERAGLAIDRRVWAGRAWTVGWLVLPLPLLFHPWFLRGVVWPLIELQ
jgi:alginate O-acetyltransferase complex protein AlgI